MPSKAEIIQMCKDNSVPYSGKTKVQLLDALERELSLRERASRKQDRPERQSRKKRPVSESESASESEEEPEPRPRRSRKREPVEEDSPAESDTEPAPEPKRKTKSKTASKRRPWDQCLDEHMAKHGGNRAQAAKHCKGQYYKDWKDANGY